MKNDDLYSLCKRFATGDPNNRCTTPNAVYNALQRDGVKTLVGFFQTPLEELAEIRYVGPKKLIVMAKMKYEDRLVFAKRIGWCSPSLTVEYVLKEWDKDYTALDDFFEKVIKGEIDIIDKGGKKVPNKMKPNTPRKVQIVVTPAKDEYTAIFDSASPQWRKNQTFNLFYLKSQESYFNDLLKSRGHVFLNEVYDGLGFPRTQKGAIAGWIMGTEEDYIDFGLEYTDQEDHIELNFNVQGVIYDLI